MTTALELITSARYDLKDEKLTQYSNDMLLDYLNRGLRPLCAVLAAFKSDWVNTQEDLTLASGDSSTLLPSLFVSDINIKIDTDDLIKKSVPWIRDSIINSSSGQPSYYAIQGLNLLLDREADEEYTITCEYNTAVEALEDDDDMPFNDEFNDVMRQFVVVVAKARNEYSVFADAAMQDFFYAALLSKLVARNHIPSIYRTDF